jgi:hypothetical protein
MDAGKPRGGGARHVVVGIPFSEAAPQRQNPAAGAERQLQVAEAVLHKVWPEQDPLAPAVVALGETTRPRRGPALAWATALGTVAAFTAILLGWLALRDDPSGSRSIRHGEPAGYSSELNNAPAAVPGRARMSAGHWLPPIPTEPWRNAHPTDQTRALVYALGTPKSLKPAPPDEPFPTTGKPTGAVRAASRELSEEGASAAASTLPAVSLIAAAQGAPQLDPSTLIARGDEFLRQSDVVSARLFYRLAAANGSAAGAIAMGSTYDPVFLARNAVRGVKPEPEKALVWYRTAAELGDPDGKTRTAQLLDELRLDAARGDVRARAILDNAAIE